MPIIPEVLDYLDDLTLIRRDIHAHPETQPTLNRLLQRRRRADR